MENINNLYTAENDQQALTVAQLKEILNQVPEDQLDFEVVCVDKINEELRGIPVSNVIVDVQGKQLTLFNFILRNKLRIEAIRAQMAQDQATQQGEAQ